MIELLDCISELNAFVFHSFYYGHFCTKTLGNRLEPPYAFIYGLKDTAIVLLCDERKAMIEYRKRKTRYSEAFGSHILSFFSLSSSSFPLSIADYGSGDRVKELVAARQPWCKSQGLKEDLMAPRRKKPQKKNKSRRQAPADDGRKNSWLVETTASLIPGDL